MNPWVGLLIVVVVLYVVGFVFQLLGNVVTALLPVAEQFGGLGVGMVHFFQYSLWMTTAGNVILAAGVLLLYSKRIVNVFRQNEVKLLPKLEFDVETMTKVMNHILLEQGEVASKPYVESLPSAVPVLMRRLGAWLVISVSLGILSFIVVLDLGWIIYVGPTIVNLTLLSLLTLLALFFSVVLFLDGKLLRWDDPGKQKVDLPSVGARS